MNRETVAIGDKQIQFETGKLAAQAHGSAVIRMGDSLVLVTAVAEEKAKAAAGFFPLTVEYRETTAAVGRIPTTRNRREGRPEDHEILRSRLVDRAIRPLFPEDFRNETQVITTLLSAEPNAEPGLLAMLGASLALHLSDIPWNGPVAALRVVRLAGQWLTFPDPGQRAAAELDLIVAVGPRGLLMVEGEGREVAEETIVQALQFAQQSAAPLLTVQQELRERFGKPKRICQPAAGHSVLAAALNEEREALRQAWLTPSKTARRVARGEIRQRAMARLTQDDPAAGASFEAAFEALERDVARSIILSGQRFDGRRPDEVRPLASEAGLLPRCHGSALFTRGETQALASCTLGTGRDAWVVDDLFGKHETRFFIHYNFPPFSVGEVRPLRGVGRREIGHGTLATRALRRVIPEADSFPYVIRIVSDILQSNGSSSMATVCAATLAMLDAGVPLAAAVAGVAMGLVVDDTRQMILTDIQGDEDHLGDMDFKVAGTRDGVTAVQMDIKIEGLDAALLSRALLQAQQARQTLLDHLAETLAGPRPNLSPLAPRLLSMRIRPDRKGDLIGPGGTRIRQIQEETGASIDLEEDGLVRIGAPDWPSAHRALERIEALVHEATLGEVYRAKVQKVLASVAFVELFPGTEAVLHISEVASEHIDQISDILREGESAPVRVMGVDRQGRIRVSRKAALDADPAEIRDWFATSGNA